MSPWLVLTPLSFADGWPVSSVRVSPRRACKPAERKPASQFTTCPAGNAASLPPCLVCALTPFLPPFPPPFCSFHPSAPLLPPSRLPPSSLPPAVPLLHLPPLPSLPGTCALDERGVPGSRCTMRRQGLRAKPRQSRPGLRALPRCLPKP